MGKNISKASKDDAQRSKRLLVKKVLWSLWVVCKVLWQLVKKVLWSLWVVCKVLWQLAKKVLPAFGLLGVCVTIWIVVTPRVFVYTSVALDPANPVLTMFVVRNEGYLAIRDVKFESAIKYITLPDGTRAEAAVPFDNRFFDPNQVARVIDPGEEWSEKLPFSGKKNYWFKKADIAVKLSYRPYKWRPSCVRKELHRFETRQGKDGQWHWFPQPINK